MAKPVVRKFEEDLDGFVRRLRADIEARASHIDTSPAARLDRRRRVLADWDFRFFAYTYFPHHIRGEPSPFQRHFCERMPMLLRRDIGCREWWVAPRGECKSSLATKIGPVFVAVMHLLTRSGIRAEVGYQGAPPLGLDYALLFGAELRLPTKLLEVVKTELVFNAALIGDFPEACGPGPTWKVGEIMTNSGTKIEPFGADQAVRGTFAGSSRPGVMFGDDLITDKDARSAAECARRWDWLEAGVDNLGPPDGSAKFFGVGTILSTTDPISMAKQSPRHVVHHFKALVDFPTRMDMWERMYEIMATQDKDAEIRIGAGATGHDHLPSYQYYARHRKSMEAGATVSWPSVRSLYDLMTKYFSNRRIFQKEQQGIARESDDILFSDRRFYVSRLPHWVFYGGCDPSMGMSRKADHSALVVGGINPDAHRPVLHIVEASSKRRPPSRLKADLYAMQRRHNCVLWGWENNNAWEWARDNVITEAGMEGLVMPAVGITTTESMMFQIESLEPFITGVDPRILFHARHKQLLAQLDTFPEPQSDHHYDLLAALYLCYAVAVRRRGAAPTITTRPANTMRFGGY